jgi:hypothetical protein
MFDDRKRRGKKRLKFLVFYASLVGIKNVFFFSLSCVEEGDGGHRGYYCAGPHGTKYKAMLVI